jgi:hypothetical protein
MLVVRGVTETCSISSSLIASVTASKAVKASPFPIISVFDLKNVVVFVYYYNYPFFAAI